MSATGADQPQELRPSVPGTPPWAQVVLCVLAAAVTNLTIGARLPAVLRIGFAGAVVVLAIPFAWWLRKGLRAMVLSDVAGLIAYRDIRGHIHEVARAQVGAIRAVDVRSTAIVPWLYVLDWSGAPLFRLNRGQWNIGQLKDFFLTDGVAFLDDTSATMTASALRRSDPRYVRFGEAHAPGLVLAGAVLIIALGTAVVVALGGH